MSKPVIRTYDELLAEKKRLRTQLQTQKAELNGRVTNLKEKLAPIGAIISAIGGIKALGAKSPLVKTGAGLAVDLLLKKRLFKKSGLVTGLVGSFLIRNVATKLLAGTAGVVAAKLIKKFITDKKKKPTPG